MAGRPIDKNTPVCVTGASGFVAAQIVKDLLHQEYRVRGTVRDTSNTERYAYLTELDGAAQRLELTSADLLEPQSFKPAVKGCEYVLHTASPYLLTVKDPQRDLVDPAVQGTLAVLEACREAGEVKRVVLTSSVAAITDEPPRDHVLTEEDWNTKSSLTRNPYYYSKTRAERAAWDFVKEHNPGFDLVVINPFLVIGPSLTPSLNVSNRVLRDILAGAYPGIINVAWGFVDVRDVSLAHIKAMEKEEASGRHLCANVTLTMRELVEKLRSLGYEQYKLPRLALDHAVGDAVVRLSSYLQPKGTRSFLQTHLGRVPRFDNRKIREGLEMEFLPIEKSLQDTIEDLVRWGHLRGEKRLSTPAKRA